MVAMKGASRIRNYNENRPNPSLHIRIEAEIRFEVRTNGPVEVSFDVYKYFYAYSTGIYQHMFGDYVGGHVVKLMGWGEETGTLYMIIPDSWNVF